VARFFIKKALNKCHVFWLTAQDCNLVFNELGVLFFVSVRHAFVRTNIINKKGK
jgi:hypothetical protein